ncbi:dihydroxyacetone kinase transcriptional activator DhaS [Salisediminibacterium selenitireducens]|uniref:Transcriptional regulator, TetR family n=1 Tax=Bacillus selenitireducens (strain ATCC 700615 / DSM 15326 / MLS10) TaxID=439292 RepID=D6Y071_BACIE|nr:dihydroxyacetone kinase transcriptional activator DhaS [Salisediminibacterium selenitireducens]ADH98462.1 transcriptional regulator, TetR family [[Bacillus] selenitireducens MLS10]
MTDSLITKKIIAKSLKELMARQPFQKISVRDIMERAGLRRQTFYYHFQDKFELLTWIYQSETREHSIDFFNYDEPERIFTHLLYYVYDNREFYEKAIQVHEQNGFFQALSVHIESLYDRLISEWAKRDGFTLSDERREFIIRYYSKGFIGFVETWLAEGCRTDARELSGELNDVVHKGLRNCLNSRAEDGGDRE